MKYPGDIQLLELLQLLSDALFHGTKRHPEAPASDTTSNHSIKFYNKRRNPDA